VEDTKVLADMVWRNKNLADTFEPGSIFKIVTVAAGLEDVIRTVIRVNDSPVDY
jgi:cell division protein FtsI/penicillin-binding protein 2